MAIILLDDRVNEDLVTVKKIIGGSNSGNDHPRINMLAQSIYKTVLDTFSGVLRNSLSQIEYLSAYEAALAVFRSATLELRTVMDVLTLEQRLAARNEGVINAENDELKRQVNDAIMFSNRYALFFAGHVGLALLNTSPSASEVMHSFGSYEASKDRDMLAGMIARQNNDDLIKVILERKKEPGVISDEDLKLSLETIFTSWINQFSWTSFNDVAERFNLVELTMQYGNFSITGGHFKRKYSTVIVDEKFMNARREDVINSEEYVSILWKNLVKLLFYDHDRRGERDPNPFDPAGCIFTYGAPGGGKTFIAHALIRELARVCEERALPFWAFTHSTSDYASEYQNKTANMLDQLALQIRAFPGPVVMYVADADNIFQSRKDARLTAEQQQTLAVYFKMFDGQLIPRNGKFMAIMDANYIDHIDDATKSRLFDRVIELERFKKPHDFARLVRNQLTKGAQDLITLTDEDWLAIGQYLLDSPLGNREIGHVVKGLRGNFDVPESLIGAPYAEVIGYRNEYFREINREVIVTSFQKYIETRLEMERKSREARLADDAARFLQYLTREVGGELKLAQ